MRESDPAKARPGLRKFLPSLFSFALVAVIYLAGGLEALEYRLTDLRFQLTKQEASDGLVIVMIDPPSLGELSVWPWPRTYHAQLVDNLVAAGARHVAFDIEFSAESSAEADEALVRSFAAADKRVVLPIFKQLHQGKSGPEIILTEPLPALQPHVRLVSINAQPEKDSIVRRMSVLEAWREHSLPSLSAFLAGKALLPHRSFYIDFGISPTSIPRLSFADVFNGRFDPAVVAGKQVIIGATALQLQDYFPVPVHVSLSGVIIHALAYQSLVQGRALQKTAPIPILLVTMIVVGLLGPRLGQWSWKQILLLLLGLSAGRDRPLDDGPGSNTVARRYDAVDPHNCSGFRRRNGEPDRPPNREPARPGIEIEAHGYPDAQHRREHLRRYSHGSRGRWHRDGERRRPGNFRLPGGRHDRGTYRNPVSGDRPARRRQSKAATATRSTPSSPAPATTTALSSNG